MRKSGKAKEEEDGDEIKKIKSYWVPDLISCIGKSYIISIHHYSAEFNIFIPSASFHSSFSLHFLHLFTPSTIFKMAKSARASAVKKNKQALKQKVFGPVEKLRNERLAAKLEELVNQQKSEMEVDKTGGGS